MCFFYFQYCHSQLPSYLQSFAYTFRMDIHEYNTRNKTAVNTGQVRIKAAQNSIRNMTSKIVNTTPDIIINKIFTHSLHVLQHMLSSITLLNIVMNVLEIIVMYVILENNTLSCTYMCVCIHECA